MHLKLENIGMLRTADIDLKGITVIAGNNNSGKSTVGKTLYAVLKNAFTWKITYNHFVQDSIKQALAISSVELDDYFMNVYEAKQHRRSGAERLQKKYSENLDFLEAIESYRDIEEYSEKNHAKDNLREFLRDYCLEYARLYNKKAIIETESAGIYNEWINKMLQVLSELELSETEKQCECIKAALDDVFRGQYKNLFCGNQGVYIRITDDMGYNSTFSENTESLEELDQTIRISNHVLYYETPRVLDLLGTAYLGTMQREIFQNILAPNVLLNAQGESLQPIRQSNVTKRRLDEMYQANEQTSMFKPAKEVESICSEIQQTMRGQTEYMQKDGLLFTPSGSVKEKIKVANLSTGTKAMAVLERILALGCLKHGDILILDEPEINLHPEWQNKYAEIIVKLQKALNLHVLVTTHSPYFLRALEVYSDIYDTFDSFEVYTMVESSAENPGYYLELASDSPIRIDALYERFTSQFDELQALLDKKYGHTDSEFEDMK